MLLSGDIFCSFRFRIFGNLQTFFQKVRHAIHEVVGKLGALHNIVYDRQCGVDLLVLHRFFRQRLSGRVEVLDQVETPFLLGGQLGKISARLIDHRKNVVVAEINTIAIVVNIRHMLLPTTEHRFADATKNWFWFSVADWFFL